MKKLPDEFDKNGFHYRRLDRTDRWVLLEKTKPGTEILSYEIVRIFSHSGRLIAGREIEPAEFLASSEQWGVYGWTETTLERAWDRYNGVLQAQESEVKDHGL